MIENCRPNEYLESIYQVDFQKLHAKGIKALILDLDETLLPREIIAITPVLFSFIDKIKSVGFEIFLLSNSLKEERVTFVAKTLDIPSMTFAMKPFPFAFNYVCKKFALKPEQIAVIGDQLFMDILGGNLAKMYTVLVKPMTPDTMWLRKLMRIAEGYVLRQLGLE